MSHADLERVVQTVLNTQQAAYVALLNAYIALVAENAALRGQQQGEETARGEDRTGEG